MAIFIGALLVLVVSLGVGQVVHNIGALLAMDYYTNPDYYQLWSPFMLELSNPSPDMEFFSASIGFGFIRAILFVAIYLMLGSNIQMKPAKRGLAFGILIFLVATVSYSLSMFLLLSLPSGIIVIWALENLAIYAIAGALIGRILSKSAEEVSMEVEA